MKKQKRPYLSDFKQRVIECLKTSNILFGQCPARLIWAAIMGVGLEGSILILPSSAHLSVPG